ncbi:hypothetical protein [Niabella aquatica]
MESTKPGMGGWYGVIGLIVGTCIIPLSNLISDNHFKEKETAINQMGFYDKYVKDLIARQDNTAQQVELAKYFSCVTESEASRKGWIQYYHLKNEQLKAEKDSLKKLIIRYKGSFFNKGLLRDNLTDLEEYERDNLLASIQSLQRRFEIVVTPTKDSVIVNTSTDNSYQTGRVYIQYNQERKSDAEDLKTHLQGNSWVAPGIEKKDLVLNTSQIRYFNVSDKILAEALKSTIESNSTFKNEDIKILFIPLKAPLGQLEVWLKKKDGPGKL